MKYMTSFIKRFESSVRENWQQSALNNYRHDSMSYAELAAEIETLHLLWQDAGLKAGDKIALNAHSTANWITTFMATVSGGYVAVQLFNGYTPTDTQLLVDHSDSKLLFTERSIFERMDFESMPQLLAAIDMNTMELLAARGNFAMLYAARKERFERQHPNGLQPEAIHYSEASLDTVCGINYTSGSTGNPKGVMLTVGNFSANVEVLLELFPFKRTEGYLSMLPLAHIFGLTVDGITPLCAGMHLTILATLPIPATLKSALQEVRPRMFFAVPLVLTKMIDYTIGEFVHSKTGQERLSEYKNHPDFCEALRTIFLSAFGGRCEMILTGGAAIPAHIEELLATKLHVPFMTGYGMTECAPVISIARPDQPYKLKSCGKLLECYHYRIDSPDPERLAGELMVKGPCVFVGYYKNEAATAAAFTQDGFFRTGDLGMCDCENTLFLVGRCKSMLLSENGQNIFPEEIEVVLNAMPYVAESIIVQRQSHLVALIVPNQELIVSRQIDAASLAMIMRENLDELNRRIPAYSAVIDYELLKEPFAKTPKGSIKRFMYA